LEILTLPLAPFEPGVEVFFVVVDDEVAVEDEVSPDGEDDDEESDDLSDGGFADAAHGAAANPIPMPNATASPPTRPT
jgi:hypothetical protein